MPLVVALSVGVSTFCYGSTGIYTTGYGTQTEGMGGVSVATGESSLAPAENPAGIAFSGDRLDMGSGVVIIHAGSTSNGVSYDGKTAIVPLPEFGYVHSFSPSWVFGVASWTSGSQISYGQAFGGVPGNSNTFGQAIFLHLAPTVAYRFGPEKNHAIAFSVVGALSTINVEGIEAQTGQPNPGRNTTPGYGFKIGWMSQFSSQLSLGAFYASKIRYQPWDKYQHIFPDGGRFQEPEQYGVGIAYRPTPQWLLGFDWIRFNYAKTHVLGNPLNFSAPLGAVNGSGNGFTNVNAYRFGVQYAVTDRLTVRGGFEIADQVMTSDNTSFTFIVPVTDNRTYTLGATYRMGKDSELSFSYAISPRVQAHGTGASTGVDPYAQNNVVSFTYTKKF
ncbi:MULTISPECIES: OmpP1/FadL family transporter [unclassified Paraburkholderia]|uniref:OmpP1/FadL family transporter n=1 Tax=Paraburkholderia TaxID=1822464 RepID=UPI001404B2C4|nr:MULTISPECIES: porin [unclassified Paraburkholderia]